MWWPLTRRETCHGHEWGVAFSPLTTRAENGRLPHSEMERKKCNLTAPENTFREHGILVESLLHLSVLKRRARKNNVTIAPNRTLNLRTSQFWSSAWWWKWHNGICCKGFWWCFCIDNSQQSNLYWAVAWIFTVVSWDKLSLRPRILDFNVSILMWERNPDHNKQNIHELQSISW